MKRVKKVWYSPFWIRVCVWKVCRAGIAEQAKVSMCNGVCFREVRTDTDWGEKIKCDNYFFGDNRENSLENNLMKLERETKIPEDSEWVDGQQLWQSMSVDLLKHIKWKGRNYFEFSLIFYCL